MIVQAFLLVFCTAVCLLFLFPDTYKATAKIHSKQSSSTASILSNIGLEDISSYLGTSENDIDTIIELAKLEPVLSKVVKKLQLRGRDNELMEAEGLLSTTPVISSFFPLPYIELKQVNDTDILEIKVIAPDPDQAAMIANTLAEICIDENKEQNIKEYRSAHHFISEQIKGVKDDYVKSLNEIKEFQVNEGILDLEKETLIGLEKIAELFQKKEEDLIGILEYQERIAYTKLQLSKEKGESVSGTATKENPAIEDWKKTIADLELQLVAELTENRPEHPSVKVLQEKLSKASRSLNEEVVLYQNTSPELRQNERELNVLRAHLKGVDSSINTYLDQIKTLPEKSFLLTQLELEFSVSQKLYSSLLEYMYEIGLAESMILSDFDLVELAIPPNLDDTAGPGKMIVMVMAGVIGILFGIGLTFVIEYLDDSIKTPEPFKKKFGLLHLGSVPYFKIKPEELIKKRNPKDPVNEAYRNIRNSIKYTLIDNPPKTILLTSSIESEGKSTTSFNLALSFAAEGKQVVLVDLDLRRPNLHNFFKMPNSEGITNAIVNKKTVGKNLQQTGIDGLFLLSSGPTPSDPGGFVESEKLRQFITDLATQFDLVIIDSPPILYANDAIVLSRNVDASVLVVHAGKVSMKILDQTWDHFQKAGIKPVGAVLNNMKSNLTKYYYYG